MDNSPWYHGAMSRPRAEELLKGQSDGVYLIRTSVTYKGDQTLSLACKGKISHYLIRWVTTPDNPDPRLTIDNNRYFNSMTQLIDRYSSPSQKAFCTRLVRYLPKTCSNEDIQYAVLNCAQQQVGNQGKRPSAALEQATGSINTNDFVLEELNSLRVQVEDIAKEQDRLDMWGRRKIILFHGVAERASEDLVNIVIKIIRSTLRLQVSSFDISRSNRLGRSNNNRPRPIVVKFKNIETKNSVWHSKVRLDGTGIKISEFLTKTRYKALIEARKRFGAENCWTKDGCVMVITADGSGHRVTCVSELNNILNPLETTPGNNAAAGLNTIDKIKKSS